MFAVPAVLQFMLMVPGVDDDGLLALRTIVYGASPISVEVLSKSIETFGCDFIQAYGLTETTGAIVVPHARGPRPARAERPPPARRGQGHAAASSCASSSADTGEDAALGEVGEIWARTGQNMKGYWNKPEETADDHHRRTAGSRPATPATSTRTATSTSTTA